MELRVLHYFLAVAREGSISAAAASLHLSQPTLSTQLRQMEEELGKQLLIRGTRGSRRVELTDEGRIVRRRAEEILALVHKMEGEVALSDDAIEGDVYIGAGESDTVRLLVHAARQLGTRYPGIRYHIASGNADFVIDRLDKGLIDLGLVYTDIDPMKYQSLLLPAHDRMGVLMRRDDPLADRPAVEPQGSVGPAADFVPAAGGFSFAVPLDEAQHGPAAGGGQLQSGLQRLPAGGRGVRHCAVPGQADPHRRKPALFSAAGPAAGAVPPPGLETVSGVFQGDGNISGTAAADVRAGITHGRLRARSPRRHSHGGFLFPDRAVTLDHIPGDAEFVVRVLHRIPPSQVEEFDGPCPPNARRLEHIH